MMESPSEKYNRVHQMALDDGETWDLSPNDKAALLHVLVLVYSLADEIADLSGYSIDQVLERHAKTITPDTIRAAINALRSGE